MSRQKMIDSINQAVSNREPYADSLIRILQQLDEPKLNYFLDTVAPYYISGPGAQQYMTHKDMEYLARIIRDQNKDVQQLLGADYRTFASRVNTLPNLQSQTQVYSHVATQHRTNEQRIVHMNQMIDAYVTHRGSEIEGKSNEWFNQSANINYRQISLQGWKFHISANNLADYEKLLDKMLPEFDRLGVQFKVVRPEKFEQQMMGPQAGKAITIYPTPDFDINKFSPELRSILFENGICPTGDAQIQGRICARYGQLRGEHTLLAPNGDYYKDTRGQCVSPAFVSEHSPGEVLNFYADAANRANVTGDYKTYVQEMAMMTRGDGYNGAYVTLCIHPNNADRAESIMQTIDTNKTSLVFELQGATYALVNKNYAYQIMSAFNNDNLSYVRPEWDERFNVYEIQPELQGYFDNLIQSTSPDANGNPLLEMVDLGDGRMGVKVDTTINKEFLNQCTNYQLPIREYSINQSGPELQAQGIEQHIDTGDWQQSFVD